MARLDLVFDLIGRDVSASRAFNDVGNAAERAGKQGEGFGSRVGGAMKLAGGAIAAAGIGQAFVGFVQDAIESEKIAARTANVIATTGGAAKITADQVSRLATAISNKTAVDDEAVQSASNLLLTFTKVRNETGKGNDIFNQATQAAVDMSVALGTDANGAALQLGKALNDPIKGVTSLTRAGVSFTQQQKDQIRAMVEAGDTLGAQRLILAELQTQFGGAAAAAANPLERLRVIAGNLGEDVGGFLLPTIERFANFLSAGVLPALGRVSGFIADVFGPAFRQIGEFASQVFDILFRGDFTGGPFEEDSAFVDALFTVRELFERVAGFVKENLTPILIGLGGAITALAAPAILGALGAGLGAVLGVFGALLSPVALVGAAIASVVAIFVKAYQESAPLRAAVDGLVSAFGVFFDAFRNADAGGGVSGFFQRIGTAIQAAFPVVTGALADIGRALVDWIAPQIMPALQALGGWLAALGRWVLDTALPRLAEALLALGAALVGWIGPRIGPAVAQLGEWLGALASWIGTTGFPRLLAAAADLGGALLGWIGDNIGPAVAALGGWLGSLVTWIVDVGLPRLLGAMAGLGRALIDWIAPQVPGLLGKLGEFIGSAVGWIVGTGLPLLVGGLLKLGFELVTWVLPRLPELLGNFARFIAGIVAWLVTDGLPTLAGGLFNLAASAIRSFWEAIEQSPVIQRISDVFGSLVAAVTAIWNGFRDATVGTALSLLNAVVDNFSRLRDGAVRIFTEIRDFITVNIWAPFRDAIVNVARDLWDRVAAHFTSLRQSASAIFSALRDFVLNDVWAPFRDTVVNIAQNLWDRVAAHFTSLRNSATSIFTGLRDTVVATWTGFRDVVVNVAQNLWDSVVDRFSRMRDAAVGIFNSLRDVASNVWGSIRGAFTSGINSVIDLVNKFLDVVNNVAGKVGINLNLRVDRISTLAPGVASGAGTGGSGGRNTRLAAGGQVPGWSPNDKADNIPAMLTADEWVHPVAAVKYYGRDLMSRLQHRLIPREQLQHLATGGQIFDLVRGAFPRAKLNSAFRPGDPGFHGRNQAADLGEAGFAGGAGRPYIAAMKRWFVDNYGRANEIIYNGIGNDRTNIKNGRPLAYSAAVQRQHQNHLHVAIAGAIAAARGGPGGAPVGGGGGGIGGFVREFLGDVAQTLADPIKSAISSLTGGSDLMRVAGGAANKGIQAVVEAIRARDDANAAAAGASAAVPAGRGVERWRPVVHDALRRLGLPLSLDNTTLRRMQQESGGNPRAINNWDVNARRGTPSKGLMQVIDPTFRANALPGFDRDVYDPLSNILASMRYALRRYGSLPAAYNRAGGYALGGLVKPIAMANGGIIGEPISGIGHLSGRSYTFGERGPETVTPGVGRSGPLVYVEKVESTVDLDLLARQAEFRERMGAFS
ncbi:MAG: transglycosylase SLT domain-containing protein [Chloroflexota bacterium]|nr:transglycosylase SLT domain-containing protein [Chloroflexota bacterium]